jgi:ADP-ribose pyrophosphatase
MQKPEHLARKTVYASDWVNLHLDKVRFPGGRVIDEFHLVDIVNDAVAVVIQNENGDFLLIQSLRYPTDSVEWEIPGGNVDAGEGIIETAMREAVEESGYQVRDVEHFHSFYPMIGRSNMTFHITRATAVEKVRDPDPNEVGGVRWVTRDELKRMISNREIRDGYSLVGLLWTLLDL